MFSQQIIILFVSFSRITYAMIRVVTDSNEKDLTTEINFQFVYEGGLFNGSPEDENNIQAYALEYALTERFKNVDFHFEPEIKKYLTEKNAFDAAQSVCELMQNGVAGIFGPQSGDTHYTVQAICDSKEIPHVLTRWESDQREGSCSINLFPYPEVLSQVFAEVVKTWEWRKYVILYENRESLLRVSNLIKAEFGEKTDVHLRKLVQDEKKSYRRLLGNITETGIRSIILDCSLQLLPEILKQAQQVGLMGADYSFIITNLDFHTLDLESYKYSGTNITAFRLFNPEDENIVQTVEDLNRFIKGKNEQSKDLPISNLELDTALIIDAVDLYVNTAVAILDTEEKRTISAVPCSSPLTWPHGYSIINHMKMSTLNGLTGAIKFDHRGFRSQFSVQILELGEDGLEQVGNWTPAGMYLKRRVVPTSAPRRNCNLRNITFNVMVPLTNPYGMLVKSHTTLKGNARYEGFCVDLIQELSRMSYNFSINLIAVKSAKTGNRKVLPNKTVVWDGIVGSIVNGEADLACGDLTITKDREEAVDFTSVFMNLGVAILYKKPKSESPGFFSFLSPFKPQVWILVVTAYVGVSLLFFVMGRLSPYEWTNPFPCIQEPDELENQFTLTNSFWFTVGALMQQGSEIAPIAVSTRVAAGIWWFFTLIMVACYTANLAAFLTTENPNEEFSNVEELAQQSEIKYGAKAGGATYYFFNDSSEKLHKQIFNYMTANAKDVLFNDPKEGVKRAANPNEKYAFLMESSQIEYEIERECSLTQIGKQIDDKGYGIAMKKGSCYLGAFSQNILKMQEDGRLADLKRKWWKEKYAGTCAKEEKNDAEKLGLSNVGGVFLVLGLGVGVAFFVALFEQFIYVWNLSREEQISIKEHLKRELAFFLQCHGTTKPVSFENDSNKSDEGLTYD